MPMHVQVCLGGRGRGVPPGYVGGECSLRCGTSMLPIKGFWLWTGGQGFLLLGALPHSPAWALWVGTSPTTTLGLPVPQGSSALRIPPAHHS